jgi:hypothetical protein
MDRGRAKNRVCARTLIGRTERDGKGEPALPSPTFRHFPATLKRRGLHSSVEVAAESSDDAGRHYVAIQIHADFQDGDAARQRAEELLDIRLHVVHLNGGRIGTTDSAELF